MPQQLDDSILGLYEKFLLYGDAGTGKTHLAGTLPPPIYALVLGLPNELKTLRAPTFIKAHGEVDIRYDCVEEVVGERGHFVKADAFDKACDVLFDALKANKTDPNPFKSIIIENGSVLQDYMMNKAITLSLAQSKDTLKRFRDHNILIPADNDWMGAQSLMDQFLDWLVKLPYHLVFIAHEWNEVRYSRADRSTTIVKTRPLFVGKQRQRVPVLFDNVFHMEALGSGGGRIFQATTVGTESITAKVRVGGVLEVYERDPSLSTIIGKFASLKGGKKPESQATKTQP